MTEQNESSSATTDDPAGDPADDQGQPDSNGGDGAAARSRRRRRARQFPSSTFEEALALGQAIQQYGAGQRIRRLTLFEHLRRSADSSSSRQMVTSSGQYGITIGSYAAEYLELTPDGSIATSQEATAVERLRARFRLAIGGLEPFGKLYEQYKDNRVPAQSVMVDFIQDNGVQTEFAKECVETFIVNAKFLQLLRNLAGAERLLTLEHVEDELRRGRAPSGPERSEQEPPVLPIVAPSIRLAQAATARTETAIDNICFYIAPIGSEGSEERKHSDLFMGSLVEPAMQDFDIQVIRADAIGKPGMITAQIIERIVRARIVIADLSFHNPNVFYELALRHAVRKPIVQLIRAADKIPFDLSQFRTIVIDTTNIYTLVPQIETYRAEIASQIRRSLEESDQPENPLSLFYPPFWSMISRGSEGNGSPPA